VSLLLKTVSRSALLLCSRVPLHADWHVLQGNFSAARAGRPKVLQLYSQMRRSRGHLVMQDAVPNLAAAASLHGKLLGESHDHHQCVKDSFSNA
jgi:hypothetical protein